MEHLFGVIFDMDGVIVDSNPVHKKSIKQFCNKYQKEVSDAFLREKVFGRKNSDWIPELFGSVPPDQLRKLSREKEELFRELFDPRKNCVNGLIEFVEDLCEHKVPMAVATSAPAANSSYILRDLSIRKRFKAVLHTSDVKKGKPAPDIYEAAAAVLRLKPQQCIVFEDSPTGTEAGQKAGCLTVGVATTYRDGELDFCSRVIDDFAGMSFEEVAEWMHRRGKRD